MSRKAQHLYEPGSTGRAMGPETARPGQSEIAALAYELWKARGCLMDLRGGLAPRRKGIKGEPRIRKIDGGLSAGSHRPRARLSPRARQFQGSSACHHR